MSSSAMRTAMRQKSIQTSCNCMSKVLTCGTTRASQQGKSGESRADAIQGATKFLYFISAATVQSVHCLNEVEYALDTDIVIVPVYLDDTVLPPELDLVLNRVQALYRSNDRMYAQHLLG